MKRILLISLACLSLVASSISPLVNTAYAATPPPAAAAKAPAKASGTANSAGTGQALEIAPPVVNLTVNPGQVIKTQISLRDVAKNDLIVTNEINDFVASGEDGTPKILLSENEERGNPFSIRSWLDPIPQTRLAPQQIRVIPVTIKVPKDASPGGHYGVIRFTGRPPGVEGTGVGLSASIGSLFLIRVNGDVKETLSTTEFSINQGGKAKSLIQKTPFTIVERLLNTGNTHEQPAGNVIVYDMFNKPVGGVSINTPPRNILPSSTRKFEQQFDKTVIGNKRLFGRYKAVMNVNYGAKKQTLTEELTFWVIPYSLIGIIIVALIVLFFGIRFALKSYKRRILNGAGRGRRR